MDKAQLFWSAYRKRLRIGFSTCGACERIVRLKAEHLAMKFRHSDVWTRIRTEAAILACHDYAHLLKRRVTIAPQPSISGVTNAQPFSAMKAFSLLSSLQSADIVLPTTDGREIRLRRITEPTAQQKAFLQQLGLALPERFEPNRKCSVDSAIA